MPGSAEKAIECSGSQRGCSSPSGGRWSTPAGHCRRELGKLVRSSRQNARQLAERKIEWVIVDGLRELAVCHRVPDALRLAVTGADAQWRA